MLLFATSSAALPPPRLVMARRLAMKAMVRAARFLNFSSALSRASAICSAASTCARGKTPSTSLLRRHARPDLDAARQAALVVAEEVYDDARDVLRLKLPGVLLAHRAAAELGVDRAGHDVADLDAVVPHLLHERLAEAVERELRGVVGGHPRVRVRAGQRRNVDDVAAAPPLHLGDGRAAAVEDAEQVRLQHRAKLLGRSLLDGFEEPDARVVDEHVHAAELLGGVRDEGCYFLV